MWTEAPRRGADSRHATLTEPATKPALAITDTERRQQREQLKRRIADGSYAEHWHRQACEAIAADSAALDKLADEHVARCEPLQQELEQLERRQADAVLHREPINIETVQRRAELLSQLRDLNQQLEDAISRAEGVKRQLEAERFAAAKLVPVNSRALEDKLYQSGDLALKARCDLAKHDRQAAETRLDLLRDPLLNSDTETLAAAQAEVERTAREYSTAYDRVIES